MKYVALNALHPVPNVQNVILHAEIPAADLGCQRATGRATGTGILVHSEIKG